MLEPPPPQLKLIFGLTYDIIFTGKAQRTSIHHSLFYIFLELIHLSTIFFNNLYMLKINGNSQVNQSYQQMCTTQNIVVPYVN